MRLFRDRRGFEIGFLPVGNGDASGDASGDAIAVRWGTPGNYQVLIYDGGTKETGEALVQHVLTHCGTARVDHVVSSHPDGDHASGLAVVLQNLQVQQLWMHRPWEHSMLIHGTLGVSEDRVRGAAFSYAERLVAACDVLAGQSPAGGAARSSLPTPLPNHAASG